MDGGNRRRGGYLKSVVSDCTTENLEERLLIVNNILLESERYTPEMYTLKLNEIQSLIPPGGFGYLFVYMNAMQLTTNENFKSMVLEIYEPRTNRTGGRSMKRKRKSKRRKSLKKKQRKTKRKGRN